MGAAAVHQHAVQLVLVALGRVAVLRQVLAAADIQVQRLLKLISIVDLSVWESALSTGMLLRLSMFRMEAACACIICCSP